MNYAITTTLIPRENIFWLEEWIKYHLTIGFDAIYLYDNTGSERYDITCDSRFVVSLSGFNYKGHNVADMTRHLSDEDIRKMLDALACKYDGKLAIVPWRPLDEYGHQFYGQTLAYKHFLEHFGGRFDWAFLADVDEFLVNRDFRSIVGGVSAEGYNEVRVHPKLFADRVIAGKPVIPTLSITTKIINHSDTKSKQFVKCSDALHPEVHHGGLWKSEYKPAIESEMMFHHYRMGSWWSGGESVVDSTLLDVIPELCLHENIPVPLPVGDDEVF